MLRSAAFKRHRSLQNIILFAVRGFCRFRFSYQDDVELLEERGFDANH